MTAVLPSLDSINESGEPLYAVLGHPIAHSLSPVFQNAALRALGLPGRYVALDCPIEKLAATVAQLRSLRSPGWNCTLPLKTAILPHLDALAPSAQTLGACNTVVTENGRLIGHNTDGAGWEAAVAEAFALSLPHLPLLILGAGGAGRAVALHAAAAGAGPIQIANRAPARAHALAAEITARFPQTQAAILPWDPAALTAAAAQSRLIVHATSLSLQEGEGTSPLPAAAFRPGLAAHDLTYRTDCTLTPFLTAARKGGAATADGLGMLLHQGARAFTLWTGRPAPLEAMRAALPFAQPSL